MERDNELFRLIGKELRRQRHGLELIASENFVSKQVLEAMGSCLTNKYAEGYPGKRYYGGCQIVDQVENLAIDRAKNLFGASWVNVQPHSGSQANSAVMLACLKPGDKILGFDLSHGGHLTHGSAVSFSGKLYKPSFYGVNKESGRVDYDQMEAIAMKEKPVLLIAGASSYSRDWDYARMRLIADTCGALLLADIAHPAGLIAKGLLNDPLPHCHIITTTTHKTLRGPRGGMIMMGKDFENPFGITTPKGEIRMMSSLLDSAVFPGSQGGPLEHIIAAKAVSFGEALEDSFKDYGIQVIKNAKVMADGLSALGYQIISGGTENHSMLIDLRSKNLTGRQSEDALVKADITVNKNMVPFDDKSPFITSGIRIGTAAITSRGLKEQDIEKVIEFIDETLMNINNESIFVKVKTNINTFMENFPLYEEAVYPE